ncbi:hypothetical protein HZA97_01610 [Candidatus Woesearchaeota archaeon]|nr:hypothetical protein [Candidatus Woesearchaeota archaeon]
MKQLISKNNNIWVSSSLEEEVLREKILNCDAVLSDLDDTDTNPTAPIIIRQGIKRYFYRPEFITWWMKLTITNQILNRREQSDAWKLYSSKFIDAKERKRIRKQLTPQRVNDLLFPGVKEFYSLITPAYKTYVTRNLYEVGDAFGCVLGFDEIISGARNKEIAAAEFINAHPQFRKYLVKGDSHHDEGMIDALKFYQKKAK